MAFLRWRIELARRTHTVNGSWRFDPLGLGLLYAAQRHSTHGFLSAICATRSGNWREDSESAAVYSNEPREMMLTGSGDGIAIPSEQIESGIRSITTDDIHT